MIAMIFRFLRLPVILIVLIILTLTAFTAKNLKTEINSASSSQLVLVTSNPPETFNFAVNNVPSNVFSFIYSGLLSQNGVTGKLEPALAESWEISGDRLENVQFSALGGAFWNIDQLKINSEAAKNN